MSMKYNAIMVSTFYINKTLKAISMFGMMVLLIALLKITNSCSVWVPSEAAIFNRNEWYNTVADGPEISVGNDLPKEFR